VEEVQIPTLPMMKVNGDRGTAAEIELLGQVRR
jgi:hypothetical protein